jgi:transcriptional regulator with XRE-family HTH domain
MEEIIFPNQIRMYRRVRNKSMQALADYLNISLSAVSKIEKGYRRVDKDQLAKVCAFLDCEPADVFVNEATTQPEVIEAWRMEQERRSKINERSGIKTIGAGFRYLRGQQGLTLADIAKAANLTLSVYHRVEMGQREVTEKEFVDISRALGFTPEELQVKVYDLDRTGALEEFIQPGDAKFRAITSASNSYADLPIGRIGLKSKERSGNAIALNVYGYAGENGDVVIDKNKVSGTIMCPPNVSEPSQAYGVNLCSRRLGAFLPSRSILVADPAKKVVPGDIALLYTSENTAKFVSIREDEAGNFYGVQTNPEEKVAIDEGKYFALHKICSISIA